MACMEHECVVPGCKWSTFNNERRTPCPTHGFENTRHHFDEAEDADFNDYYEPPERDDEEGE